MGITNKGKRIWKNKPPIYLGCPSVCSSLQGNFGGWQESVVLPCPKERDVTPTWKEKPFQGLSRNSGCPNWYFLIFLVNSSAFRVKTYPHMALFHHIWAGWGEVEPSIHGQRGPSCFWNPIQEAEEASLVSLASLSISSSSRMK